tara:strand:- start:178 stop:426 length:249 start_codon:yes stop_codon:yes gene_type:complete
MKKRFATRRHCGFVTTKQTSTSNQLFCEYDSPQRTCGFPNQHEPSEPKKTELVQTALTDGRRWGLSDKHPHLAARLGVSQTG